MNIIEQNPFRILGVPSNASAREIAANQSRLKAYLAASKAVSFPLDSIGGLPAINRTTENVSQAISFINLPQDKLRYALFWFLKPEDSVGTMAWEYLIKGDENKAIELFSKRDSAASLINRGVLSFVKGNNTDGLRLLCEMIHCENFRTEFVNIIAGDTFQTTEDEIVDQFLSTLFEEIDALKIYQAIEGYADKRIVEKVRKYAVEKPIALIEEAIAKVKDIKGEDPNVWLKAGKTLSDSTRKFLLQVQQMLGNSDLQYQHLADKLANQILQCSINYFNNSDERRTPVTNAKQLAEYAAKIAVGKMTKDRCDKAVNTLKDKECDLPPAEVEQEVFAVFEELRNFCNKPDQIEHSVTLLNNTKPKLQIIKTRLGASNSYYLKLSTQVVGNALHNVIAEVNSAQNNLSGYSTMGIYALELIKPTFQAAWKATLLMDQFDIEADFRSRYNTNRNTLRGLCGQLGISTYTSNNSDTDWGTIIGWIIGITVFIICLATCN